MDQEDFEKLRLGLKSVQDTFGFFQDTEIQALNLRRLVDELFEQGVSVDTMLALGQLLGVLGNRLSRGKKRCLRANQPGLFRKPMPGHFRPVSNIRLNNLLL